MQYLLTPEEYNQLKPAESVAKRDDALAAARKLILGAAGFTCILEPGGPPYCYRCPIGDNRSETLTRDQSRLICPLRREYPK